MDNVIEAYFILESLHVNHHEMHYKVAVSNSPIDQSAGITPLRLANQFDVNLKWSSIESNCTYTKIILNFPKINLQITSVE